MGPPSPRPCASCPYRRDVPSGVWAFEEYEKLRGYDRDMGSQAPQLFQCHQTGSEAALRRMCAGWVGSHGGRELLALRLALIQGRISAATFAAAEEFESTEPLFASGAEAADHGQREIEQPGLAARNAMRKVARSRRDIANADLRVRG
ncbi:DUF6283 family protein [Nocardia asteroides]|uniref:DUF6283 family protein n=1 Tax=Nocardia asteroides TaxID=1824 RepID=UPI001E600B9D|nr:DUF6283 family protein [Nocardia asteroides]UGT58761.1 DUF6283 family protein [Nocardia asteroides]